MIFYIVVAILTISAVGLGLTFYIELLPAAWAWVVLIPTMALAAAVVLRQPILEWLYTNYPRPLPNKAKAFLRKIMPYYAQLNPEAQKEFERRIAVFQVQKTFQMRAEMSLPEDLSLFVAATAIQMTFGQAPQKEFFPKLGVVIFFPQTFITPDINEQLHACEVKDDSKASGYQCMILALNILVEGIQKPHLHYNIALHSFAVLFEEQLPKTTRTEWSARLNAEILPELYRLRGFPADFQARYTASAEVHRFALVSELFFTYPERLEEALPSLFEALCTLYGQNPRMPQALSKA